MEEGEPLRRSNFSAFIMNTIWEKLIFVLSTIIFYQKKKRRKKLWIVAAIPLFSCCVFSRKDWKYNNERQKILRLRNSLAEEFVGFLFSKKVSTLKKNMNEKSDKWCLGFCVPAWDICVTIIGLEMNLDHEVWWQVIEKTDYRWQLWQKFEINGSAMWLNLVPIKI